jgi:hypothetical protein
MTFNYLFVFQALVNLFGNIEITADHALNTPAAIALPYLRQTGRLPARVAGNQIVAKSIFHGRN